MGITIITRFLNFLKKKSSQKENIIDNQASLFSYLVNFIDEPIYVFHKVLKIDIEDRIVLIKENQYNSIPIIMNLDRIRKIILYRNIDTDTDKKEYYELMKDNKIEKIDTYTSINFLESIQIERTVIRDNYEYIQLICYSNSYFKPSEEDKYHYCLGAVIQYVQYISNLSSNDNLLLDFSIWKNNLFKTKIVSIRSDTIAHLIKLFNENNIKYFKYKMGLDPLEFFVVQPLPKNRLLQLISRYNILL